MKIFAVLVSLLICANCGIPDIPVDEQDIDEIKTKLDKCISSLEMAQEYLLELSEELQKCIDANSVEN